MLAAARGDADAIAQRAGRDRVDVVPNVVRARSVSRPLGDQRLLFVGNLTYEPNRRAVLELAEAILHPPLPGVLARAGLHPRLYDWTLWPAIGLLPEPIREAYGFRCGTFERAVAAWLVAGWQGWNPRLPAAFRQMPQALAADRRMAGQ